MFNVFTYINLIWKDAFIYFMKVQSPDVRCKSGVSSFIDRNNYHLINPYKPSVLFVGICKQCKLDQTPQKAASDQGLHCLLAECYIKI